MLRALLCSTITVLAVLPAFDAGAIQRGFPQVARVTSGASHRHPIGRSWGRYLAFTSTADLTGDATPGVPQVYVFSAVDYMCRYGRPEAQLASEEPAECPDPPRPHLVRATGGTVADAIDDASVNRDGTLVAYSALGSHAGKCAGTPGAASRRQVFVRDLTSGEIVAVTCSADGHSRAPTLDADGGTLAFVSNAKLTGRQAGVDQVWTWGTPRNADPSKVRVLTGITAGALANGQGPSGNPMLNALGRDLVFESRADLLGDGHDTGVWNVFWYDAQSTSEPLVQVTRGNGDSRNPYIEETRPGTVFFDSEATDLPVEGGEPEGRQIYRANIHGRPRLPAMQQITFGPGDAWMPAVAPGGGRVLFLGDGDLFQNGSSGVRLFALDFRDDPIWTPYQITGRTRIDADARIGANLGGWLTSFASEDDVGGAGVCGRQLWVVAYDPGHWSEPGRERLTATQFGQPVGEPAPGSANDSCQTGNPCTAGVCVGGQSCSLALRSAGSPCGTGDPCDGGAGSCTADGFCALATPLDCDDADACTDDVCDPTTGCGHTPVVCDDGDPCTSDVCDAVSGCAHEPLPGIEAVGCYGDQITLPSYLSSKKSLKQLRRALALIAKARQARRPRGQERKLARAVTLLERGLANVSVDPALRREERTALTAQLLDMRNQANDMLRELRAGGSK